jgi:hypothetical protein
VNHFNDGYVTQWQLFCEDSATNLQGRVTGLTVKLINAKLIYIKTTTTTKIETIGKIRKLPSLNQRNLQNLSACER